MVQGSEIEFLRCELKITAISIIPDFVHRTRPSTAFMITTASGKRAFFCAKEIVRGIQASERVYRRLSQVKVVKGEPPPRIRLVGWDFKMLGLGGIEGRIKSQPVPHLSLGARYSRIQSSFHGGGLPS